MYLERWKVINPFLNAGAGALSGATLFKMPKTDFEAASRIDENITKSADGSTCTCNVCGKVLSVMSSARRHYKTTHEVIFFKIILTYKYQIGILRRLKTFEKKFPICFDMVFK